jgi:hypothetical protein
VLSGGEIFELGGEKSWERNALFQLRTDIQHILNEFVF